MKQTLLNSAGALALVVALAGSAALADENEIDQHGPGNLVLQDFTNGSENGNGSGNHLFSDNDNDGLDLDANVTNAFNDESRDDDDGLDLDVTSRKHYTDTSKNYEDDSKNVSIDRSLSIEGVAYVVSSQHLEAAAAGVDMHSVRGDLETGRVSYGHGANTMAAGNMTTSNNTGAGTITQSVSGIQANGKFRIGN